MPTLDWLMREDDIRTAGRVPYRLLEEAPDLSAGDPATGNMLIQGDNLEALKALLPTVCSARGAGMIGGSSAAVSVSNAVAAAGRTARRSTGRAPRRIASARQPLWAAAC